MSQLVNVEGIAKRLDCSKEYVRRLHRQGKLPTKKRFGAGISCWDFELDKWAQRGKSSVVYCEKVMNAGLIEKGGQQMNSQFKDGGKGNIYYRYYKKKTGKKVKRWYAWFYVNGKRKDLTLKDAVTKSDAKKAFLEIQRNLFALRFNINQPDEISFEQFADSYIEDYAKI